MITACQVNNTEIVVTESQSFWRTITCRRLKWEMHCGISISLSMYLVVYIWT